ncbi:DeoR/GlpR family DNA-binding transcription regulator [Glaciihabitans sp. dw_435]|uniref:DeoR/GlpR family DNA-binding transcription regulator n=1 Tax=Glaciihabitans sp. dw_435 TaxID=2720081 RepID=UPI001BD4C857|nr:DeoR/GlpR family DNA-binding transcription regulator [Glaciihabitans sp. dw_435]
MPRDTSTAARREKLAALVSERGFLRVTDAGELLGVSEVTVRGDLTALERDLVVVRTHGGAMPRSAVPREPTFEQAVTVDAESKRAIGELAASLVSSGQSVILDVGSTALAVAHALVRRTDLHDVAIITNGLSIALALEEGMPRFTVVVTGGTLRPLQHSLVNPSASGFFDSVHADIAFIGCNGIDPDNGVTNINFPEAEIKRRMIQAAAHRVLIADRSKLGRAHLGVIGAVGDFHRLVTGGDGSSAVLTQLRAAGLDVLIADDGRSDSSAGGQE